jgi:outer membrane protein assembly factor BamB
MLKKHYTPESKTDFSGHIDRYLLVLTIVGCWFFTSLLHPSKALGHDWPMWRYDAGRGAVSPQKLPAKMHLQWVRQLDPPKPAWPKSQYRLQFDASYEPVVAGKTIFIGSMVTDSVTAYETETGRRKWRFYADGPVRFAPVVYKDKLYFACDDGYLYCLNARNGSLIRRFLVGPSEKNILGNDRLIGMWPVRGGPVLYDGKIYFAAGIWPFMGIFIHAIDAQTADIVWTNSGSGETYLLQPHSSPAFAGVAPQGYLVATEDKLLISGGRSVPAAYDRRTGKFLYYHLNKYGKTGACEVIASDDCFFNRGAVYKLSDGFAALDAPASVIQDAVVIGKTNDSIMAYKLEQGTKKIKRLWQINSPPGLRKIHLRAGSRLYGSGEDGIIMAIDTPDDNSRPKLSWTAKVDGEVWSMLAADDKLFVVTLQGRIHCFADKKTDPKYYARKINPPPAGTGHWKEKAREILKITDQSQGYCLLLGIGTGQLLYQLANQSELNIVAIDPAPEKVESARRTLDQAGIYGRQVSVLCGDITTMQLPSYMANLIVSEDPSVVGSGKNRIFEEHIYRSLRPYGGTACFSMPQNKHIPIFKRAVRSKLPCCHISSTDDLFMLTRYGPLPDTADWTHQYGDSANTVMSNDKLVKAPLGLLWFGGPSNDKILPRHGHGPSPQVVDGRLFIEGRDMIRAVDVYTGRLLWERQFRDLGRFYDNTSHQPGANEIGSNYVTVSDGVYVVYADTIHVLDPATGEIKKKISMPGQEKPNWGTIMVWEDILLAAASPIYIPLKDKKEQTENLQKSDTQQPLSFRDVSGVSVNADYASASKLLVAMDRHTGKILWKRSADYSFRHNAVITAAGRVFCIDGMSEQKMAYLKRRGLSLGKDRTLYALNAETGQMLWKSDERIFGTWLAYSSDHDVLLEAGSRSGDRAKDEVGKGMTAYRAGDGKVLWRTDDSYKGPPILYRNWVITQTGGGSSFAPAEAKVFDLLTGKYIMREHPMTGQIIPWTWVRFKGCNTAIASENLLTFRSASGAFIDLTRSQSTASIGGFKSGCTSNLIVANGVLNAPDYTRTCVCSYQNQSSLALVHTPAVVHWTFDYYRLPDEPVPVKKVGINFGAPGNHYADDNTLWLEFPSVGGPSPDIPVRAKYENPGWFRSHASKVDDKYNWITASGVTGLKAVSVRMFIQPGENPSKIDAFDKHIDQIPTWNEDQITGAFDKPRPYTVRLYFAENNEHENNNRIFDISLQGKKALEAFDVLKEAGRANRTVIKEFKNIKIKDDLEVTFTPSTGAAAAPLLCGIEIIAEAW